MASCSRVTWNLRPWERAVLVRLGLRRMLSRDSCAWSEQRLRSDLMASTASLARFCCFIMMVMSLSALSTRSPVLKYLVGVAWEGVTCFGPSPPAVGNLRFDPLARRGPSKQRPAMQGNMVRGMIPSNISCCTSVGRMKIAPPLTAMRVQTCRVWDCRGIAPPYPLVRRRVGRAGSHEQVLWEAGLDALLLAVVVVIYEGGSRSRSKMMRWRSGG